MHFLTDIVIAIVTTYLAFTNTLATNLANVLAPLSGDSALVDGTDSQSTGFQSLPSRIGQAIPDILLQSREYQQASLSGAGDEARSNTTEPLDALVNIYCTFTTTEYIKTTTGTGFFIDTDGVILTNAHVAQFLLLEATTEQGETDCIVRSGNPAAPKYQADLLYLPPAWILENAGVLNDEVPMGTGERDYALLYVSSSIDSSPLPAEFPALNINTQLLPLSTRNTEVVAAGYPAGNLRSFGPNADLLPQKATTSVSELYTFGSNYADVFSIRGSIVGAEGASGGPIVNQNGSVIGMIVTRGDDATDGAGSLRAITISHVERTIQQETGFTLQENLQGNLSYRSEVFADTLAPFLLRILQSEQTVSTQ